MRIIILLGLLSCVFCKTNTKSLTESMGQEVIELAAPIKDVPPDLDEEPSAEADEPFSMTSTTLQPATARDGRRATAVETRRKMKDIDKIEGMKPEEDEARIEKELAELYKDTDYKADSAEVTKQEEVTSSTSETMKPIARLGTEFKFQPDLNNPREVEKFRTSVDEISCDKKLTGATDSPNSGHGLVKIMYTNFFWAICLII